MTHRTTTRLVSATALAAALVIAGCGGRPESAPPPERYNLSAPITKTAGVTGNVPLRAMRDTLFEESWPLQLPGPVHTSWISPNAPDLLFVQIKGADKAVHCIEAMSGLTRWKSETLPGQLTLPPYVHRFETRVAEEGRPSRVVVEQRLFLVSDDKLYCINVADGAKIWERELDFSPSTGPVAQGTDGALRVFLGDWTGRLQVVTRHPEKGFTYQAWQWNLERSFTAQPLAYQEQIYIGDHGGGVSAFRLDRDRAWNRAIGGPVHGGGVARDRALFIGNDDNVLYALNRLSGLPLGQLNFNGPIRRAPFVASAERERVYVWVTSVDPAVGGLYAVRTQPDRIPFTEAGTDRPPLETVRMGVEWFAPGAQELVCSTPEHLFVTAGGTIAYALNRKTGAYDWSVDLGELHQQKDQKSGSALAHVTAYQDPTDANRSFYTVDQQGRMLAYRLIGYRATTPSEAARSRAEEMVRANQEAQRARATQTPATPAPTPAPTEAPAPTPAP